MGHHVVIDGVDCYGELQWDSNFYLKFEDEEEDFIWVVGNPDRGDVDDCSFRDWEEAVACFKKSCPESELIEVEAV